MSQEARNIMQGLRNKIETQSHAWTEFKAVSTLAYIDAYKLHKGAIEDVNKNIMMDNERFWAVAGLLWSLVSAAAPMAVPGGFKRWGGRLISEVKKVQKAGKELAGEMFDVSWKQLSGDLKKAVKDTAFEIMSISTDPGRPVEVISDDPLTYEKKMEAMLERLAIEIMSAIDQLVERSQSWSEPAAREFVATFVRTSPYFTDLPDIHVSGFDSLVRRASEKGMWMQWAIAYEPQNYNTSDYMAGNRDRIFDPILDRLWALGVPLYQVSRKARVGGTYGNHAADVLDLRLFAKWARSNMPMSKEKEDAIVRGLLKQLTLLEPKFKTSQQCRAVGH